MGQPAIENRTALALFPMFSSDEDGRTLFVPLLQATYAIVASRRLEPVEPQPPPRPEGILHDESAEISSYRVEPPVAFTKLATDVVLCGKARSPRPVKKLDVSLRVGPVGKTVRIVGDRVWASGLGGVFPSDPRPFDEMPLAYERAFGGWDLRHADPLEHRVERRNPLGVGFCAPGRAFEDGVRLPNLEDPADPIERWGQIVAPAGFGFVSPEWEPRASLGGTYDAAWRKERMPLLPEDFDRRFFSAASAGLVAPGFLRGGEPVAVTNVSFGGSLSFNLPGLPPMICRASLRRRDASFPLQLDTVIIDTDDAKVSLWYRGHLALRDGPHDLTSAEIAAGPPPGRAQVPAARS